MQFDTHIHISNSQTQDNIIEAGVGDMIEPEYCESDQECQREGGDYR